MTATRDPDRLVRAFLEEGQSELPDRTYDAVREEIESTPQRSGTDLRRPTMSTFVRVAIAAAAVIAVVIGASTLLPTDPSGVGGPGPSSSPPTQSPSVAPSVSPSPPPSPVASIASPAPRPTDLVVADPFPVGLTFAGTDDLVLWGDIGASGKGWYKDSVDPPNGIGLTVWSVSNVYTGTCGAELMDPPLGDSVDALADALIGQPMTTVEEDRAVTIDGFSGRYLQYVVGDLSTCPSGTLRRWQAPDGSDREAVNAERDRVWILDVDGTRVVIDVFDFPLAAESDQAALIEMVESVEITTD